jgi:nanoRNase/pAp phosphatase (c-di-AMP/oligoRNAs hydrolase)
MGYAGVQVLDRAESFVRSNPDLTVVVLGAALLLVVLAYLSRRRTTAGDRFQSYLDGLGKVSVLTHPNPDPDALAAGMAVAHLAESVGTAAVLQYPGEIRHQENRAFRTVLDVDCEPVEHVSDLGAETVVLVDHNVPRGFAGADGVLPDAVIDHHPGAGRGEAFTDVRTDYGACASILAEYLRNLGARPVPSDSHEAEIANGLAVPSDVATALLYGVLTDTDGLTSGASPADFSAAGYLYPGIDEDCLNRIANPQVDAEVLEVKARAIAGRSVRGPFAVSHIGDLSNTDAIPQAADELAQLEGVTAVVVCGVHDGTVHLSGRSRDDRVHMGRVMESIADEYPRASGGGHARMGGGKIRGPNAPDAGRRREALVETIFDTLQGAG